jgi:hypothetical protein
MKNTKKTTKTALGEAVVMSRDDFDIVSDEKYSPTIVVVEEENIGYYNSFTCYNSYYWGGNCRCISHSPKVWEAFDPETGRFL